MIQIPLGVTRRCKHTGIYVAIVDDVDADWARQFNWTADVSRNGRVYAVRRQLCADGVKRKTYMHREVWQRAHEGESIGQVDHREHGKVSGLDNRRSNLRLADTTQNAGNQRKRRDNTSGFKGVSLNKRLGRWEAYIDHEHQRTRLGWFDTPESAARAYDAAAVRLFGEFALVNFPNERVA